MDEKRELAAVLKAHKAWLADISTGQQANLRGANLSGANLREADLRERHERLRAHCDGLAEKVRGMRPPLSMTVAYILGTPKCGYFTEEMTAAWEQCRESVLAILEGDAS